MRRRCRRQVRPLRRPHHQTLNVTYCQALNLCCQRHHKYKMYLEVILLRGSFENSYDKRRDKCVRRRRRLLSSSSSFTPQDKSGWRLRRRRLPASSLSSAAKNTKCISKWFCLEGHLNILTTKVVSKLFVVVVVSRRRRRRPHIRKRNIILM